MGRHSSPTGGRLAPALVLGLTLVSVGSPLGLILATRPVAETVAETSVAPQAALLLETSTSSSTTAPKKITPAAKTQASHTTTSVRPTTSVKRTEPTTAPKRVQQATTSSSVRQQARVSTTASPKPQIASRTTTSKPPPQTSSSVVKTSSPPITKTTTPPVPTTSTPPSSSDPPKAPAPTHLLVAQVAQKYVGRGIPYRMGGNSLATGMDCSHFVWMVLKEAGYSVAYRPSDALAGWVQRTSTPQPGDLVLFRGHVGIFVGNGMMVDQGSSGGAHLREIKYYDNFIGYGRIPI